MKGAIILCVLGVAAISMASNDHYTSKYDGVDLDEILNNRRLLMPYVKCVLNQGKCTADGKELKSHIKEALETDCAKCTDAQRKGTDKVIGHLINNEPEVWNQLKAMYDPTGKYSKKHEAQLRNAKKG